MEVTVGIFVLLLVLLLGLTLVRGGTALLRRLFLARYPILLGVLLAALGPVAGWVFPRLLRNLLVLPPGHLALVATLSLLVAWVVMLTFDMVRRYGPYRFRALGGGPRGRSRPWALPGHALLALPLAVCAVLVSPGGWLPRLGAVAAGWIAAYVLLLVAVALQILLFGPVTRANDFLVPRGSMTWRWLWQGRPWTGWLEARGPWWGDLVAEPPASAVEVGERSSGGLWAGYRHDGAFLVGHVVAGLFLAVNLAIYVAGFFLLSPSPEPLVDFPALGYVLLVLLLAGWALPAAAFFLDAFRVPPVLVLLCASIALHGVRDSSHYYPLRPDVSAPEAGAGERGTGPPPGAETAPSPSPAAGASEPPLVVVAASGGGITAAQWTARVLAGLQAELGDGFARSLRLVSAVSGGSVGTLHYLDRFDPAGPPGPRELERLVAAAGESSLSAVAWGIAYPDLWRLFGAGPSDPGLGRAWAKERAWAGHLDRQRTLGDWRRGVEAGWLPPAVLNATVMETGQIFRFSSFPVPASWGGRDFAATYPGSDLPVVRAARMSATFPWVSPISSPCREDREGGKLCAGPVEPRLHLADGGYYDNFGVVTLVQWLRHLGDDELAELRRRGLVIVQIRARPPDGTAGVGEGGGGVAEDGVPAAEAASRPPRQSLSGAGLPDDPGSWLTATLGPVFTLLSSRTASQAERNRLELEELKAGLGQKGVEIHDVQFHLTAPATLSWKLTPAEATAIRCAFHDPAVARDVDGLRSLFPGSSASLEVDLDLVGIGGEPSGCTELVIR